MVLDIKDELGKAAEHLKHDILKSRGSAVERKVKYVKVRGAEQHLCHYCFIVHGIEDSKMDAWLPHGPDNDPAPCAAYRCEVCLTTVDALKHSAPPQKAD